LTFPAWLYNDLGATPGVIAATLAVLLFSISLAVACYFFKRWAEPKRLAWEVGEASNTHARLYIVNNGAKSIAKDEMERPVSIFTGAVLCRQATVTAKAAGRLSVDAPVIAGSGRSITIRPVALEAGDWVEITLQFDPRTTGRNWIPMSGVAITAKVAGETEPFKQVHPDSGMVIASTVLMAGLLVFGLVNTADWTQGHFIAAGTRGLTFVIVFLLPAVSRAIRGPHRRK
jgi:hypothetical protein